MSSQIQPIFGANQFAPLYRLVMPLVNLDASGGTVTVNSGANKFNTNLPLDRFMLITQIDWIMNVNKLPAFPATAAVGGNWSSFWQITEALARAAPAATDPVYVAEDGYEWDHATIVATAASIATHANSRVLFQRRFMLADAWATAAQQLNLVANLSLQGAATYNGPSISITGIITYQLASLTADIRSYLATRVQIAGQA